VGWKSFVKSIANAFGHHLPGQAAAAPVVAQRAQTAVNPLDGGDAFGGSLFGASASKYFERSEDQGLGEAVEVSIGRQASFAAGEISTALYGRVDQGRYYSALRTLRNGWVKRSGGADNRPGTKFISDLPFGTSAGRCVQFSYSADQQYVILFATDGIYFCKNGAMITLAGVNITGVSLAATGVVTAVAHGLVAGDLVQISGIIGTTQLNGRTFYVNSAPTVDTFTMRYADRTTVVDTTGFTAYSSGGTSAELYRVSNPYSLDDLDDLKFTQANDVLVITHPDYPPKRLVRTTDTSWALSDITFYPDTNFVPGGAVALFNWAARSAAGTIQHRYKVTSINPDTGEESIAALETYADTTSGGGPFDRSLSSISAANPGVVTTAGNHGYVTGDTVVIFTNTAWAFSGDYLQITVTGATTFTIGIDTSGNSYGGVGQVHRPYLACASAAPTTAAPIVLRVHDQQSGQGVGKPDWVSLQLRQASDHLGRRPRSVRRSGESV